MGDYTQLAMRVSLIQDVPSNVIDILRFMVCDVLTKPTLPEHDFFKTDRWNTMLNSHSSYFDMGSNSHLRFVKPSRAYWLTILCDFKHYESEIPKFIDWIKPYVSTKGTWGFFRTEEQFYSDANPTTIIDGVLVTGDY